MAARGKKFSWMRLINNAFPVFAFDDPNDVNLSPIQADNLLRYQLLLPHPRYLSETSVFIAGIAGSEAVSKTVYKALVKTNIILPIPDASDPRGGEVQMTVNTAGITKDFANQQASISVHAQRKLVAMLFFWEEECTRWKLLDAEEKEILSVLEGGDNRDLAVALEAVEMKRKLLPSQRGEGTANVGQVRSAWKTFAKNPFNGLRTYAEGWPQYNPFQEALIRLAYDNQTGTNVAILYNSACDVTFPLK